MTVVDLFKSVGISGDVECLFAGADAQRHFIHNGRGVQTKSMSFGRLCVASPPSMDKIEEKKNHLIPSALQLAIS